MDIHIDGIAGGDGSGNYALTGFSWGQPGVPAPRGASPELTFTHDVDNTSADLMQLCASHQTETSAEVHVHTALGAQGIFLTIHMSDVTFVSIRESGDVSSTRMLTDESVTIRFRKAEFTFQHLDPAGRPLGQPVSFTWTF
jgi:type VI protein secretion system component Hcp